MFTITVVVEVVGLEEPPQPAIATAARGRRITTRSGTAAQ